MYIVYVSAQCVEVINLQNTLYFCMRVTTSILAVMCGPNNLNFHLCTKRSRMVNLIKPADLSYEDYLKEKEANPLFFWNYKPKKWSYNGVFIGNRAGYIVTPCIQETDNSPLFNPLHIISCLNN